MARLKDEYTSRMVKELESKLNVTNKMLVPRLQKIVINMGFGIVSKDEQKALVDDLTAITGQKPQLCKAKKSISNFKLREGMVIGASFARTAAETLLNRGGLTMAVIIGLHNIPEGMAVAVPLISGGMPKVRSVLVTALTGFPTILGAALGFTVGAMGPTALALSLSFASGAMLYVVFGELMPEAILMWRSKLPAAATVIGMLTGVIIIYA